MENEVAYLKDQCADIANLLTAYVDRLGQLDQSHASLNQTVSDLSISIPSLIVDAKKGKEIAREELAKTEAEEKSQAEAAKKATHETTSAFLAEQEAAESCKRSYRGRTHEEECCKAQEKEGNCLISWPRREDIPHHLPC